MDNKFYVKTGQEIRAHKLFEFEFGTCSSAPGAPVPVRPGAQSGPEHAELAVRPLPPGPLLHAGPWPGPRGLRSPAPVRVRPRAQPGPGLPHLAVPPLPPGPRHLLRPQPGPRGVRPPAV